MVYDIPIVQGTFHAENFHITNNFIYSSSFSFIFIIVIFYSSTFNERECGLDKWQDNGQKEEKQR